MKEKQIDEMMKHCPFYEKGKCILLEEKEVECDMNCDLCDFAKSLYNAGYRKQEWISVENGLPEDGNYITFTNANGKDNGVIAQRLVTTTIRGKVVRRWEWLGRISPWIVTHYMPLPEPPKMKGGAE